MQKKCKNFRFPLAKVRKIIQKNDEIGKIDSSIPFIVCKSRVSEFNQRSKVS